jgi:hypothetical protein
MLHCDMEEKAAFPKKQQLIDYMDIEGGFGLSRLRGRSPGPGRQV